MGIDQETIIDFYTKECRSILEYATPVWTSGLTKKLSAKIERVQKVALSIATGHYSYGNTNYIEQCQLLGVEPLFICREKLNRKFALKTARNSRHIDLFQLNMSTHLTRNFVRYREPVCRTARYRNSPLPYLTRLLNED